MAGALSRECSHPGALGGATGESPATGAVVGHARRPEDRERRADPHGSVHPFPPEARRPGPARPGRQRAGPRAGGAPLPYPAASRHRLLSRGSDGEPVRPRRGEGAGVRHRPRDPDVLAGAVQDRGTAGRAVPTREGRGQAARGDGELDLAGAPAGHGARRALASEAEASQRPVVRLVDLIISEGILARSSDIHIEPEEGGVAVRYRIDGVLRQVMKIPRQAGLPLISRIKIMSQLDIADRLRPQDGRARVAVNGQPIDLRVSTLPAALGEKVVIRILDSRATVKSLDSLGLNPNETEGIKRLLENHEGILLVTGPTGSGKTTTLYSCINQIKSEGVNIVTVEDPVEYRMQGIVQVQVQEKAGLTFASALRSILRQDPNVVLIGEIRDRETAQIAVQASLTGHLVLSTLHTNDAANAVTRLVDIGVEAYKIAAALRGVLAQRLMRKLCPTCKEVWMETPADRLKPWVPKGTP